MLSDRRAIVVTGAASGIGRATAVRFGRLGCAVVLVDRNTDGANEAADAVRAAGASDTRVMIGDVGRESDVREAVERTIADFGRLDVVVNNAGTMIFKSIEDLEFDDIEAMLGTNLVGAVWFIKHAFRRCSAGASIVNVSSIHAVRTSPQVAVYAAAKAGLLALTRAAAIEGRAKGIRVNAVVVGAVDTPMLHDNPNVRSGVETVDPSQVGQPDDVAAAIDFLASPGARFVNGAALEVDGGRLAQL